MKNEWAQEADVVIIGYGGAGAAAALTAASLGAQVLVLEKNPEGGGNTKYSGGTIRTYLDAGKAINFFEALCEGTTDREIIDTFVRESSRNSDWLQGLGAEIISRSAVAAARFPVSLPLAAFPAVPGADGMGPRVRVKGGGAAAGVDVWRVLSANVATSEKIQILCSCPAKRLLVEKDLGVIGVLAEKDGHEVRVRARRAVILTTGGFEHDHGMQMNYLGQRFLALCNPANTGDGIRMAAEIGADLWHMNAVASTFGYKYPEFPVGIRHSMPSAGFIYVDQDGKRFMNETGTDAHFMWEPTSHIEMQSLRRTRIPAFVIFDEDTRMRGAVAATDRGRISDVYQWSADNSVEIKKGWIKAADTVAGLANHIGIRSDTLQAAVAQYNLQCVGGYDQIYGRLAETLVPLGRAPYYAVEMWPCLFNTQGGPRRNFRAQILDVWNQPIRRLYSAGELGSLWYRNYPGAGNVSEALAFGRIAGRNAAAEQPLA